ncbi:MAG: photosystem I reaction center subunit XII [Cyanobacteria bacterium P01_F01_bin.150]
MSDFQVVAALVIAIFPALFAFRLGMELYK